MYADSPLEKSNCLFQNCIYSRHILRLVLRDIDVVFFSFLNLLLSFFHNFCNVDNILRPYFINWRHILGFFFPFSSSVFHQFSEAVVCLHFLCIYSDEGFHVLRKVSFLSPLRIFIINNLISLLIQIFYIRFIFQLRLQK